VSRNQGQIVIHHPPGSRQTLHLRIDDRDAKISPGETILLRGHHHANVQIANTNGRYGPRRSLSPGIYVSRETRRGWTLDRRDESIQSAPSDEASRLPAALELNPPGFEQVPTRNSPLTASG
jgi:hypothetical protein